MASQLDDYQTIAAARTYDAFFKKVQLHVYATLCPIDLERNQYYISTLVSFDDHDVLALDNIARIVVDA